MLLKGWLKEISRAACMVFAAQAAEGGKKADQCPELDAAGQQKLAAYLSQFRFDW